MMDGVYAVATKGNKMPGPQSHPVRVINGQRVTGKTAIDRASGKAARHTANRIRRGEQDSNPIKSFGKR